MEFMEEVPRVQEVITYEITQLDQENGSLPFIPNYTSVEALEEKYRGVFKEGKYHEFIVILYLVPQTKKLSLT